MRPYSFSKTEDPSSQGTGLQHACMNRIQPAPSSTEGHDPPMKRQAAGYTGFRSPVAGVVQTASSDDKAPAPFDDRGFGRDRTSASGMRWKLLCEELFGIGRRKPTELSAVASAVQDRHLQALQRELLVPDLFECGDTEGESSLEFRGLRQPFLLEQGLHGLGLASDDRKGTSRR